SIQKECWGFRLGKNIHFGQKRAAFRFKRILVGIQFAAAMLLLVCTWFGQNQVSYLHQAQLGMDTEQVMAIPNVPNPVTDKYPLFRERMRQIQGIQQISACMEVPSREIRDVGPTFVIGKNQEPDKAPMLDIQVISEDFIETMGIQLLAGEDRSADYQFQAPPQFSETYSPAQYLEEQPRRYLINETAMKELGWTRAEDAIGQQISWAIGGFELQAGPITGVIKDVHQESLKNQVDPMIMVVEQIWLRTFLMKIKTDQIQQSITEIQSVWHELFPAYPFEYQFLDELFDRLYRNESKQLSLLLSLSLIAVLIAFLGLFSLVAFSMQSRMREIAIRRITGAEFGDLLYLISREYLLVLLFGSLVAIPLSYYGLQTWLETYAYHVDLSIWGFGASLLSLIALVLLTVSLQTYQTATRKPAEILREQ
ncbi:MAG: FtsX-like permease family protein, partial [Bacteroidota bacterium]